MRCLLALWLVSLGSRTFAQAQDLVIVCDPQDAELLARVQGQARDLPVELRVVQVPVESREPSKLQAFLHEQAATWFVCIEAQSAAGYHVVFADTKAGTQHARDVQAAHDGAALADSATRETLALVVRSELSQMIEAQRQAGAGIAATSPDAISGSEPDDKAPVVVKSPDDDAARHANAQDVSANARAAALKPLRVSLGWEPSLPGPDHVAHALAAQIGLAHGAFEIAMGFALGASTTLTDTAADAEISRHAARLALLYGAPLGNALHLSIGAHVGVLAFVRSTQVRDPKLESTADDTAFAASLGPDLLLRWRMLDQLGLALAVFADIVPAAPRYVVRSAGTNRVVAHERVLQPGATLSVFFAL